MSNFEEKYLDVLQNIEVAIVQAAHANSTLIDIDVLDAVTALVRHYGAEENGLRISEHRLAERPARVYAGVKDICEWRIGRQKLAGPDEDEDEGEPGPSVTVPQLVECLRRVQKSIRRWNKEGGRKGYLDFVSQYVR
jgi:hypothetical protein